MRLPIDTSLIPRGTLSKDFRTHLSNVLQNLEVSRKIATENILKAQDKYKTQYDERTDIPSFQPADRVWLFCTKVPIGKAPKLHRKLIGPYYIANIGPNHTFKLRRCSDNREVKSMINTTRLKLYFDPEDRPTNPPPEWEDSDQPLNQEEFPDEDNIDHTAQDPQPMIQKTPNRPSNQKQTNPHTNNKQQQKAHNTERGKGQNKHDQAQQPNKPKQKAATPQKQVKHVQQTQNTHINKQTNEPKPSTSTDTDTEDQKVDKSKLFPVVEFDRLISSKRGNGRLYYYVKWQDTQKSNTWEFAETIPSVFIREFHANRTMSGRKRKRTLQNHKFFDKLPSVQNVQPRKKLTPDVLGYQETFHKTEIKILMFDQKDQKSYSLHIDKLIRSKRKQLIIPYLDKMFKLLKEHVPEKDWNSKQGILDDGETFEAKMVRESHTCDPEDLENSTYFKVFKLGSNKPVWLTIHQVPPLCLRHFLFRLRAYVYV